MAWESSCGFLQLPALPEGSSSSALFLVPIDWSWPHSARAQLDDYSFPYPFHHF